MAFGQTECFSAAGSFDTLLTTPAGNRHLLVALTVAIVADVLAAMPATQLLITRIIAFRHQGSANDWRFERSAAARTGLRLTVYHWTPLAETHMAGFTALVLPAVEHFGAVELAWVVVGDGRVAVRTADRVADMVAAAPLPLAHQLALENVVGFLVALDLAGLRAAGTVLLDDNLAGRTGPLVAAARADVAAVQLATAGHAADRDGVRAALAEVRVSS